MSAPIIDPADLPHDNIQAQAVAIIFVFPAVATLAVALRLYSRALIRAFALDDWVIIVAGIIYWGETYTSYKVIKLQYIGYHLWDIPQDLDIAPGWKYGYATELLYNPILALVKTSILLFLLRLTVQKTRVRTATWVILVFNLLMMVVTFLLTVFHCIPIAANWNSAAYPDAKCMNFADFVTGTACVAIFTDVLVLMLPTWIVYNLQIQRKQKLIIIGILSFGLITVIAGVVRVILLDSYDRVLPPDFTYSLLFCLSTIELGLSFIAACAPAMKPLIVKIAPKFFGTSRSRSRSHNQYIKSGSQANKLGYRLDEMSRNTRQGTNITQVDTDFEDKSSVENAIRQGGKKGIVLTTETNVTWQNTPMTAKKGTSMESLV